MLSWRAWPPASLCALLPAGAPLARARGGRSGRKAQPVALPKKETRRSAAGPDIGSDMELGSSCGETETIPTTPARMADNNQNRSSHNKLWATTEGLNGITGGFHTEAWLLHMKLEKLRKRPSAPRRFCRGQSLGGLLYVSRSLRVGEPNALIWRITATGRPHAPRSCSVDAAGAFSSSASRGGTNLCLRHLRFSFSPSISFIRFVDSSNRAHCSSSSGARCDRAR